MGGKRKIRRGGAPRRGIAPARERGRVPRQASAEATTSSAAARRAPGKEPTRIKRDIFSKKHICRIPQRNDFPQFVIPNIPQLSFLFPLITMYSTQGIEVVATITELRSNTSELVEQAKELEHGILIQKNNEPYAVLLSYDQYKEKAHDEEEEAGE
jgi:prevent-host-death family protein